MICVVKKEITIEKNYVLSLNRLALLVIVYQR